MELEKNKYHGEQYVWNNFTKINENFNHTFSINFADLSEIIAIKQMIKHM